MNAVVVRMSWRGLVIALALNITSAHADTRPHLTPTQLIPAIDAVLDGQIEERRSMLACPGSNAKTREAIQIAWETARRDFRAMLWATNFPEDFVKRVADKTELAAIDRAPPQSAPDTSRCAEKLFVDVISGSNPDYWTNQYQTLFAGIGVAIPAHAPTAAQWAAIRAVFDKQVPAQTVMLNCIAVLNPRALAFLMNDWADLVQQVAALLVSKGYPRDELTRMIAAAQPNALLKTPDDRVRARAACEQRKDWQNRIETLEPILFKTNIREIVEGKR